jgi:hypothetical protein
MGYGIARVRAELVGFGRLTVVADPERAILLSSCGTVDDGTVPDTDLSSTRVGPDLDTPPPTRWRTSTSVIA